MKLAIIDYGSGNLCSVSNAFERAAREADIRLETRITHDPEWIGKADRVVLPGVGAFADCINGLLAVDGLIDALNEIAHDRARPFLGICVGHQLMARRGLEKQETKGLGWIEADVVAIDPHDETLKVPHMGWNTLKRNQAHPVLDGLALGENGLHAYFVHSYHMVPKNQDTIIASCNYGGEITAIIGHENRVGTQFHPEKSQQLGLGLIANFLKWTA